MIFKHKTNVNLFYFAEKNHENKHFLFIPSRLYFWVSCIFCFAYGQQWSTVVHRGQFRSTPVHTRPQSSIDNRPFFQAYFSLSLTDVHKFGPAWIFNDHSEALSPNWSFFCMGLKKFSAMLILVTSLLVCRERDFQIHTNLKVQ